MKCISCDNALTEGEIKKGKGLGIAPFFPEPIKGECFVCYVRRADLDGPINNRAPNHEKDPQAYENTLRTLQEGRKKA